MKTPNHSQFKSNYEKHCHHLKLKGLQPGTIDAYARAIRRIGDYFDGQIDHLTHDQLLHYFSNLLDSHSWSTVKLNLYGLKFYYQHVLNKPWIDIHLIKPPRVSRIPQILSLEEARQLFATTRKLRYRVFFFTVYSMGLRLGEGQRLETGDIDAERKRVLIRKGKGNKDRFVPLPDNTLHVLRAFWRIHRHPRLIFPNLRKLSDDITHVNEPLARSGIQAAMRGVIQDMGLKKTLHYTACVTVMPPIYWKPVSICWKYSVFSGMLAYSQLRNIRI